jgi:hypothetical protein
MKPRLSILCLVFALGISTFAAFSSPAQTPQSAASLVGVWQWSCCAGRYSGRFAIMFQRSDGSIVGQFSAATEEDTGTLQGRLQGDRVEFVRRGTYHGRDFEQRWVARVAQAGNTLQMVEGRFEQSIPQTAAGEFSAQCMAGCSSNTRADGPPNQ